MVDQNFGRLNDPMSQPTLDSTPLGINMTNGTTSPIDSISVKKNARAYATDTTNGISRANCKRARTRLPVPIPIIVRLFIKEKETL